MNKNLNFIKSFLIIFWLIILSLLIYKYNLRESLIRVINNNLPSQEAGILAGIVLGEKSNLSKGLYQALQTTGLVHIVVASGTNVLLLTTLAVEKTAAYWGRKRAIVLGLATMWLYADMIGMDAPIVRASLLLTFYYLAQLLGRQYELGRGLAATVIIMLLADYRVITSVGFWLSMTAFLGIVTVKKRKIANNLWQTVWVMVWITPVMALVFGKVSLLAPVWNVLVLFLIESISIVGGAGMLLGWLLPFMGKSLWLVHPLLLYVVKVVEWGGRAGGVVELRFNWLMLAGWYVVLIYLLLKNKNLKSD